MHRLGINSQWCVLTTVHSRASKPLRPGRAVVVVERVARPRLRLPECRRGRGGPYSDNTRPPEVHLVIIRIAMRSYAGSARPPERRFTNHDDDTSATAANAYYGERSLVACGI